MQSRWFHRPFLHVPGSGIEKKASWLEIFYDLVFVAAFIQLGNGLSEDVSLRGAVIFTAVFVALWVAWTGLTFLKNRYTHDDFLHRTLIFIQMFAVGAMALGAPGVLEGDCLPFAIATSVAQMLVAVMYLRAYLQVPESRDYARYWGTVFFLGAVGWAVSAFLPAPYYAVLWGAATLTILGAPLSRNSRELAERFPTDWGHLGERYGLLTVIVLGESFVKVLTSLAAEGQGLSLYVDSGVILLITGGIWWVYFDDVVGARLKAGRATWIVWLYAHVTLPIGITAVGVALKKAVAFSWSEPAPEAYRWLLAGSLAVAYFSVATIDSVTQRKQAELSDRARVNARLVSGAFLLVLAPAGHSMSGAMFLVLVSAVNVAQVIFDMAMAPFVESAHEEAAAKPIAEIDAERRAGQGAVSPTKRWDVSDAIRKGAPASVRRDLYFYFMEGSWTRVFVAFTLLFIAGNIFFAALYVLEPGAVTNADPQSFLDAFFFSVQTMSTIGYGAMSPATSYGHMIVTVEAAVGIIGVAIVTGLVFAKASRPKASAMFSAPVVLTEMDGEKVLIFRVGNARGNEVVDATMDFTVMRDHLSPEGHHLRRLHDLKLTRRRSPMFVLSWVVMHVIDEESPLADVDWTQPERDLLLFVATLVGHDGTYGQTVYARKVYYPEDLRVGHRFVDILSSSEDGRLTIDFSKFDDTVEDDQAASSTNG